MMEFFQRLAVQLILILVIPGFIPIGLIMYKAYLDKKEGDKFRWHIDNWHEDCSKQKRKYMRGDKANSVYHNCATAVFMAMPFSLVTGTHQFVLKLWSESIFCVFIVVLVGVIYFVFRKLLVGIDFRGYQDGLDLARGIKMIFWGTAIFFWILSAGIFYSIVFGNV